MPTWFESSSSRMDVLQHLKICYVILAGPAAVFPIHGNEAESVAEGSGVTDQMMTVIGERSTDHELYDLMGLG